MEWSRLSVHGGGGAHDNPPTKTMDLATINWAKLPHIYRPNDDSLGVTGCGGPELVYRHELRPVITTGAEVMD